MIEILSLDSRSHGFKVLSKSSEDIWDSILKKFVSKTCDSFSLHNINDTDKISDITQFQRFKPTTDEIKSFEADGIAVEICSFKLSSKVLSLLRQTAFHDWCEPIHKVHVERLYFWLGNKMIMWAIPHEELIFFNDLQEEQKNLLFSLDKGIKHNFEKQSIT